MEERMGRWRPAQWVNQSSTLNFFSFVERERNGVDWLSYFYKKEVNWIWEKESFFFFIIKVRLNESINTNHQSIFNWFDGIGLLIVNSAPALALTPFPFNSIPFLHLAQREKRNGVDWKACRAAVAAWFPARWLHFTAAKLIAPAAQLACRSIPSTHLLSLAAHPSISFISFNQFTFWFVNWWRNERLWAHYTATDLRQQIKNYSTIS